MALNKKLVDIPFTQGIQTKKSDIYLDPGELEILENGVFEKFGQIRKRKGNSFITTQGSASRGHPQASFMHKGALYQLTSGGIVVRGNPDEMDTGGYFNLVGNFFPATTELFSVSPVASVHHQANPHLALSSDGSTICVVYLDVDFDYSNNVENYSYRWVIIDTATGDVLSTAKGRTGSASPYTYKGKAKAVGIGVSSFAIYYEYKNGSNYELRRGVASNASTAFEFTTGASAVIGASSNDYNQTVAQQYFDVVRHSSDINDVLVAYYRYDGSSHEVRYLKDNEVAVGTGVDLDDTIDFDTNLGSTAPSTPLVIDLVTNFSENFIMIGYRAEDSGSNSFVQQARIKEATPSSSNLHAASSDNGDSAKYFPIGFTGYRSSPDSSTENVIFQTYRENGDIEQYGELMHGGLSSTYPLGSSIKEGTQGRHSIKPFQFNVGSDTKPFTVLPFGSNHTLSSNLTSVHFGCLTTTSLGPNICGASLVNEFYQSYADFPSPSLTTGTTTYSAAPRATNLNSFPDGSGGVDTVLNSEISVLKISQGIPAWGVRRASLGKSVFFTAGNMVFRDSGAKFIEPLGMPRPVISGIAASSGGNLDGSATYKYKVVFEKEDNQGNLYRSEPSDESSIDTTSSNKTITVTVDLIEFGLPEDYVVTLYRTEGGGNIFHKVKTVQPSQTSSVLAISDNIADSVVLSGAFLYTDSGELANTQPSAAFYVEEHQNRLFLITEDNRIVFSKEYEKGFGVSFSDTFSVPLDGLNDDKPMALGSAGNTLFIFRENSIWAISGEGPSKTGSGSYYTPQIVSNTVGALKGSPTFYTDRGLFFQDTRGIQVIGAGGVEYIGAPIEDLLGSSRIIDIDQDLAEGTIRFATDTNVFTYSLDFQQWSQYVYARIGSNKIIGLGQQGSSNYIMLNNGEVWKEAASQSANPRDGLSSDLTPIVLKLRTGWISLNGIQGFGRAYRFAVLGEYQSAVRITVKVSYDYDDTVVDTYNFDVASAGNSAGDPVQFRGHLSKQKCESVKFEILEATLEGATIMAGIIIEGLTLEVGTKRGIFRTTESNTIGAS